MVNKQTVDEQANRKASTNLTPAQEFLQELWEEHLRHEFATHNLVQLGLLDPGTLPVVGVESARKALDPNLPSNTLIERASDRN